jgi:glycosyltransferase involved in cell wall biosynthesis
MSESPTVSVVIPTYNQPTLLLETLHSVFAQTYTDYEVVIINDGSTDDTLERLSPYADRVRVITQHNQGIGAARNRGIDEARGKYVALLDHDDLWVREKLAEQVAFMEGHPACAACSVPWAFSTDPETPTVDLGQARDVNGIVPRPLERLAQNQVLMMSSSLLFRRQSAVGLHYDVDRLSLEDIAFQILLFTRGEFALVGERPMMIYRVHPANSSSQMLRWYKGMLRLRRFEQQGGFAAVTGAHRQDLHRYLGFVARIAAIQLLRNGYRREAALLYVRETLRQLAIGRVKFVATFPALLFAPQRFLDRIWPKPAPE